MERTLSLEAEITLGFTGHRPKDLGGYAANNPIKLRTEAELDLRIEQAYQRGYRRFISGLALGFDTWVADAVLRAREKHDDIALIAAVPFETQFARWIPESQAHWEQLVGQASEIWVTNNSPAQLVTHQELVDMILVAENAPEPDAKDVNRWLYARNAWMVDNSREMFACWNGSATGGTYNCINYARSKGVRVIAFNPITEAISVLE